MIIHIIKTPNLKVTLHSIISPMRQASINNPISITLKKIWFSSLWRIMPGLNKRAQNITLHPSHAMNDADSTINLAFISLVIFFHCVLFHDLEISPNFTDILFEISYGYRILIIGASPSV